ncbi:MAG TPA: FecR family protein [Candidatus Baltobacteraceae bacterium]|nr:FecR family protein [Candidatus Baltobacteraceae bacterium]
MRRILASFLCATLVMLIVPAAPSLAAADKQLQNVKGDVSYQVSSGAQRPLAPRASVELEDNASAITGANSLGGIVLPDSSRVMIGSSTKVQIGYFTQAAVASAKFYIPYGKVRFKVEHPKGAQANYTFQTPTAQIAVRGTEGDIFSDASGNLQVNVYQVSNPQLPVQVTLSNGKVFTLSAGQSLTVGAVAGAVSASLSAVSQSTFSPFSEFGAPQNAGSFGISSSAGDVSSASTTTTAAASSLTTIAGAILGAFVVNTVVHTVQNMSSHTSGTPAAPAPSPSPSVPIVIH